MKTILSLLVFIGLVASVHAQDSNKKWFNASPHLGANYTSTLEDFTNFKGGVSAGIDLRMGKSVFFQPGAQYNYFAFEAQLDTLSGTVSRTGTVEGHYFSIPLMIGYKFTETKVLNLRVQGGLNTSLFLSGSVSRDNFKEDFKKSLNSIRIGAGLDLFKFVFDINTDIGINQGISLPDEVTTFRLTATLGYLLRS
jgi:hypothetical protein